MTATPTRRICIVTGADAKMEASLEGLLRSLADTGISDRAHVVVLDFGLSDAMRSRLADLCDEVIDPRPVAAPMIGFLASRPLFTFYRILLPTLVPGHDIYIWVDADIWVQSAEMLDVLAGFARVRDVAIVAETDPAYGNIERRHNWTVYRAKPMYGAETAHQLAIRPYLNSGLFAAEATSPLWDVWPNHIAEWRDRAHLLLSDQVTLNYLIYRKQISAYILPALYNWVCHAATPTWIMSKGYWARPLFPHTKIAVMHLTSTSRQYSEQVTIGGQALTIDLGYDTSVRLRRLTARKRATGT